MERMFSAALISPAKIGEERKSVGDTVVVTQTILLQLMDAHNLDRLSVALVFDPDADPVEDVRFFDAALIEAEVSARVALVQADADQRVAAIEAAAAGRIANAETAAADRIAVIEAAATARINAVEQDAEVRIAAASVPSDPAKPIAKPRPK